MDEMRPCKSIGSSNSSSTGEEERLKQLFLSCDSNNDGRLNSDDLYEMCYKLKMADHAEEIINMLGARVKESISLEEFLSCRNKVFFLETEARSECDNIYDFSGDRIDRPDKTKCDGIHHCDMKIKARQVTKFSDPLGNMSNKFSADITSEAVKLRMDPSRMTSDAFLSDNSPMNSGAEYDSGAHDLCDEPQDLHTLMRREYPDLYWVIFPPSTSLADQSACITGKTEEQSKQRPDKLKESVAMMRSTASTDGVMIDHEATTSNVDLTRQLFECANLLHTQCTMRLWSEVHDLSYKLRGLQARHQSTYLDHQRVERERDQLRHELSNQVARYEDRLTELHSVIAELRRRLEHTGSHTIPEADEFDEVEDGDDVNESQLVDQLGAGCARAGRPLLCSVLADDQSRASLPIRGGDDENESRSHFEPHSDQSSEGGGTSVGAIDGDHHHHHRHHHQIDPYLFHSRPERSLSSRETPAADLFKLSCGIVRDNYEQYQAMVHVSTETTDPVESFKYSESRSPKIQSQPDTAKVPSRCDTTVKSLNENQMIIDYESALTRLRTELDLAVRERDRFAQLVRAGATDMPQVNWTQSVPVEPQSSPTLRPCMGLGRRMAQSKLGGSMEGPSLAAAVPTQLAVRTGSLGSCPPRSVSSWTDECHESNNATHVYDLPEPDWVSTALKHYHNQTEAAAPKVTSPQMKAMPKSTTPSTTTQRSIPNSATNGLPSRTSGVTRPFSHDFQFDYGGGVTEVETESGLSGLLSPSALTELLRSLAERVPYPRLSEALNCAQLTWQCVLTTLARYRADCLVLQANLAEAKSHSDRMQCQLNQIDANWSATMRAAYLADASIEIIDCLNQLYATELAIMLYRQTKKSFLTAQAFSTLSSSTSSSSFPCRGKSLQVTCPVSVSGTGVTGQPVQSSNQRQANPSSSSSPSAHHPYAVYAVPGYAGTDCDIQSGNGVLNAPSLTLNLRTLRLFRYQAELAAQTLLDRYEQLDSSTPDRFYPTVSSSAVGATSSSLTRGLLKTQNTAPISPGLLSIHSPIGPTVPSTQSLTSSSVYANSWYVSLGRLGRSAAPGATEQISNGSCLGSGYFVNQTKLSCHNLTPFNLSRGLTKITPTSHPNGIGCGGGGGGGGWQTPDSGAGSSSTHEPTQPPLFHHSVYPPGQIELSSYEAVLDLMPSLLTQTRSVRNGHVHSFCDSDSESTDSSDAEPQTGPDVGAASGSNTAAPVSAATPIPSTTGWSRTEERKLRILLHQLINSRRVLRSTIVEPLPQSIDEDGLSEGRQSVKQDSFQCISNESGGKLPLNVMLESSILLQELCSVKEERADLKARVYILEKELHANRLTLESRVAAENALRAHLEALRLSAQDAIQHSSNTDELRENRTGGMQSETLLRAQVKNLLQALESLRHSSELQQMQSEELVDDLKRANSALIAAFEKAKRKYLSRIKKLEDQISRGSIQNPKTATSSTGLGIGAPNDPVHQIVPPFKSRECGQIPLPAPPRSDPVSDGRGHRNFYRIGDHNRVPLPGHRMNRGFGHGQTGVGAPRPQPVLVHGPESTATVHGPVSSHRVNQAASEFPNSPCCNARSATAMPVHRAA